jgi:hypothetical protein
MSSNSYKSKKAVEIRDSGETEIEGSAQVFACLKLFRRLPIFLAYHWVVSS